MQSAFHDLLGQGIFNSDVKTCLIQREMTTLEFKTRSSCKPWLDGILKHSPELPMTPFAVAFDTATKTTLYRFLYPCFLWRLEKVLGIGAEKRLKSDLEIVGNHMNNVIEARKKSSI
ncbi:hypothetical protein V6N13_058655 [Hibiscus sabdariffa]